MPKLTADLGRALLELAASTEGFKGPMLPPALDITSPANQQLKDDARLGDPTTIENPVHDVLAHVELLFNAACDHLRSLGTLLVSEPPSWFGYVAVARAVVETSCRQWYLADPTIDSQERVRRHVLEWQYELVNQRNHIKGGYQALPTAQMKVLQQWIDDNEQRIGGWAAAQGLNMTKGGLLADRRLGPTELLIEVFQADPAAPQGRGGVLAAYNYNRESAVAHGLPSGVAMYHQPAAGAGGHAHNVLTGEHVGHAVLPVITAFDAAFDRLAMFFRWPHGDLVPMRWPARRAINDLIQSQPSTP